MLVSDQVFRTLLEALLEGRYAPGEKLPTQRALAADLDVTMSSVREALKRLEQMGLVDVRQGDAMRVRDWRAHGGLDVVAHLVLRSGAVDPGVLGDVLEARERMLRELARLAAQRRDDAEAARLVERAVTVAATYFEHAERVPVTADPRALAPRYTRLAAAIERRDADEAAATAFALAAQQTASVREALAR